MTATAATPASLSNRLRTFFALPLRFAWLIFLLPTLAALKFAFGTFPNPDYPDYPAAWIMLFVPFVTMVVPILLTYGHLPERWRPANSFSLRAFPFHIAIFVFWALVGFTVAEPLVAPLAPPPEVDPTHEWSEIPGLTFLMTVFVVPVFMRGVGYRDQLAETEARTLQAERDALTAQVQALQARIQPHFLFNTLNTIAGLIGEDANRAERAVEKLSDVFRYALDASNAPLVPLADEIESTESFLELEALRFAERLRVSWHCEPGVGGVAVPPLLIQPLVENAVQHGIATREQGGRVEIDIRRDGNRLEVRVEDDGPGPGESAHRGAGSAMSDLEKRLHLLYGERASIESDRGPLGGFRVRVRLPLDGGATSVRAEDA